MRGRAALLAAAMMLAACATGPAGSELLNVGLKPGTARLVIYRTNPVGLLIQPDFVVEGRKAGTAQPGGFVMCDLAPGKHSISVSNIPIALPLSNAPDAITVSLRAGTTTYVRADPQMGIVAGTITLTHVADGQGRADVATLTRIETDRRGT